MNGISKETPIDRILHGFADYNLTGGGPIQTYEFLGMDKVKLTFFNPRGFSFNFR